MCFCCCSSGLLLTYCQLSLCDGPCWVSDNVVCTGRSTLADYGHKMGRGQSTCQNIYKFQIAIYTLNDLCNEKDCYATISALHEEWQLLEKMGWEGDNPH